MSDTRVLPIALVTAVVLAACGNPERAPYDFERMRLQQRADLYAPDARLPNGTTMQTPPAGTVAREATLDDTAPPAVTPALLAEGRDRFGIYCAVCHGAAGFGGSIVAANMDPPRPPSLRSATVRALGADTLFRVVTMGFGRMPSYARQLSARQRWAVVSYVQALQRAPGSDRDVWADSLAAERLRSAGPAAP